MTAQQPRWSDAPLAITLVSLVVSLLVATLAAMERPWGAHDAAALVVAVATLLLAGRSLATGMPRISAAMLALLTLQFGIVLFALAGSPGLSKLRLLQVAVVLLAPATLLSALLARTKGAFSRRTAGLCFGVAALGLVMEAAASFLPTRSGGLAPRPEWSSAMDPDPQLGRASRAHSELKTFYDDNPRDSFDEADVRDQLWGLHVAPGNLAKLEFPPGDPATVRVAIEKAHPDTTWQIQLDQPHYRPDSSFLNTVKAHPYSVSFRARADKARHIYAGFAQAHDPWETLGWYERYEVTPQWQQFHANFMGSASDSNARIIFDLGGNDIPVEVSDLRLRGASGERLDPELPVKRYYVSYRFNAFGCRGRDFPIPRVPGTARLLVLGDAFAMGAGVREGDSFAGQLERMLNARADSTGSEVAIEVINCGVAGYGSREERLFYQLRGAEYQPDLVLLILGLDDDRYYWEARQQALRQEPAGRLEQLSALWRWRKEHRRQRRSFDYAACIADILELDRAVRQRGAKLVIGYFRSGTDGRWDQLTSTVSAGLTGKSIPILELSRGLPPDVQEAELRVHRTDPHLNETAHRVAAEELARFLEAQRFGEGGGSGARGSQRRRE